MHLFSQRQSADSQLETTTAPGTFKRHRVFHARYPVAIRGAFQETTLTTPRLPRRSDRLVGSSRSHKGSGSSVDKGWRRGCRQRDDAKRSQLHGASEANTGKIRPSHGGCNDGLPVDWIHVLLHPPCRGIDDLVNRRDHGGRHRRLVAELLLRDTDGLRAVRATRVSHQALQQPEV